MGKTFEKVRMWNIFDGEKIEKGKMSPIEVESQIDSGAVRVVLPESLARKMKLQSRGKINVRYADMRVAEREIVGGLVLEIQGRLEDTTAIVEPDRKVPLIGQIVLEALDLWIDSRNGKLVPNPKSPDTPLLDEFQCRPGI